MLIRHTPRRLAASRIWLGPALAFSFVVALVFLAAPAAHAGLPFAVTQDAASTCLPPSHLLEAAPQDHLTRSPYSIQPLAALANVPVWARSAARCAALRPPAQPRGLIDLAPLYRRPPPSFS